MRKLLTAFLLQGFERTPYNFCKLRLGSASKMSSGEAVPTTVRKDAENDAVKRRLEGGVSQEPAVKLHKSEVNQTVQCPVCVNSDLCLAMLLTNFITGVSYLVVQ